MGIRLSDRHGVNPSVEQCFVCMQDKGVLLFGRMKGDKEAPRRVCLPGVEPCEECKGHMARGVVLISVDESKTTDPNNPWRTGGWVVLKDEAVQRIFQPQELVDRVLATRLAFLPDAAWDMLGLPRGAVGGAA